MREEQRRRRAVRIAEDVLAGLLVDDALVNVHGAAGLLGMRLGHEGGVHLVPQRRLARGALEQECLVGKIERLAVQQVDFHLRRAVLVDQRVDLDVLRLAEGVDIVEQRIEFVDRGDAVGLPAGLGAAGAADRRLELVVGIDVRLDQVELELRGHHRLPAALRVQVEHMPQQMPRRHHHAAGRRNKSSRGSPARSAPRPRAPRARSSDRPSARCRSRPGSWPRWCRADSPR